MRKRKEGEKLRGWEGGDGKTWMNRMGSFRTDDKDGDDTK
jgi:hypothetical protein